jgi:Putative TM nitroreductase
MKLQPEWYDAIAVRRSRRRYGDRSVAAAALATLHAFCAENQLVPGVRVQLTQDTEHSVFTGILDKVGDGFGRVEGAPWLAAFVGPEGSETEVGYLGEAFILQATALGLDTCWVAGTFDRRRATKLLSLKPGERAIAVTPVGHALERKAVVERVMSSAVRAAARRQIEEIASATAISHWPAWALTAVEAARLAPSGANRQPWRFRLAGGALVMSSADDPYWTAPIDFGIAMLHVELGAAHEGVTGAWDRLPAPDVARFVPGAD